MMKKRLLLLAALLMITAAGCGKADSENTEQPAAEEAVQEEVTPRPPVRIPGAPRLPTLPP